MTETELLQLQNIQKNILKEVHTLCEAKGIKYCLAYGSLIGAIRHKGFIPWDDDIDIFMTREEYSKFIKVKNELPDNLELISLFTSKLDNACEARVCRKDIIRYEVNHTQRKNNVPIDIFVLDYAKEYNSKIIEKISYAYAKYLKLAILDDYERTWAYDAHKSSALKKLIIKLSSISYRIYGTEKIHNKIQKLLVSRNNKNEYYRTCNEKKVSRRYNVADFSSVTLVPFEDIKAYIPYGYDRFLRNVYGDYMIYPPEDKRFTYVMKDYVIEYI